MKKKNKKRKYIPFQKTIIPVLSILMIITAILIVIYTIDDNKFKKLHTKVYDDTYVMRVLYLIMDEDNVPKDINLDKTFSNDLNYQEHILSTASALIPLEKKGDYLYADLDKYTNSKILEKETDYVFAKMNNNGEVIDGCEYEKDKNVIKVPISYYENLDKDDYVPIQIEIQTLISKSTLSKLKTNVNMKKYLTVNKNVDTNALDFSTVINLGKFGPGKIRTKDVHVYINDSNIELNNELYAVDNNMLEMYISPVLIDNIDIKVDYTLKSVFAGTPTHTVSSFNSMHAIKVSGPISISGSKSFTLTYGTSDSKDVNYCVNSSMDCFTSGGTMKWRMKSAAWSYTYSPYGDKYATYNQKYFNRLMTYRVKLSSLLNKLAPGVTGSMPDLYPNDGYTESTSWLAFYCDHVDKALPAGSSMDFTAVVKATTSNSITLFIYTTDQTGGQTANAYLRFYWDEVGIKIKKTDDAGVPIVGLEITAENVSDSTDKYTASTNSSGIATFYGLKKTKSYKFYENCSSTINYNGHTETTLSAQDINCSYDSDHPYDNGGSGYSPEDVNATNRFDNYLFIGDEFYESLVNSSNINKLTKIGDNNNVITVSGSSPLDWRDIPETGSGIIDVGGTTTSVTLPSSSDVSHVSVLMGAHGITETQAYKTFLSNLHTRYSGSKIFVGAVLQVNPNAYTTITNAQIDSFNDAIYEYCSAKSWCEYASVDEGIVIYGDEDTQTDPDYSNYNSNGFTLKSAGRTILYNNIVDSLIPISVQKDTVSLYELENIKYRMCLVASKTKGTSKRLEKDTTFKVTIDSGKCRSFPNGYTTTVTTGDGTNGELGYITVDHIGNCEHGTKATVKITDAAHKRTVIGSDTQQVSLVRSKIIVLVDELTYRGVTYSQGDRIVMTDADFAAAEQAGSVKETCPKTSVGEFEDKGYIIYWRKYNNSFITDGKGTPMEGVKFTVKKGSTTIRVLKEKFTYTDIDGESKRCYEYTDLTDNTTTTELETDQYGKICIYNLPDTEPSTYTITEKSTDVYDHSSISITSSEQFSNYTDTKYTNYEYLIDWDKREFNNGKTANSNGKLKNSTFTVKDSSNNVVKTKPNKETVYDKSGEESRSCYVVDLIEPSNNTNSVFTTDNDGYTCIIGLNKNTTYTITETDPAKYYGYSKVRSITEESKLYFNSANPNSKTVYQCPTEVKITKKTTELDSGVDDDEKKLIYEELQKLTFNVLDSQGHVLAFSYNSQTNHYEYQQAVNELTGTNNPGDTRIRLLNGVNVSGTSLSNMDLNIFINYLPEGSYTLREVSSVSCSKTSDAETGGSNCTCERNTSNPEQATTEEASCSNMGYGHIADIPFEVTDESTSNSVTCNKDSDESVQIILTNKPTVVKFTKKDFYKYYNDVDTVKFETDEEIEAFDNITFKVRKKSTTNLSGISSIDSSIYEWFYKTADGEYRYDVLHKCTREGQQVAGYTCTQNLHTENGDMRLTHLCKCEEYYIEEYEVPEGTVFILPKLEGDSCREGYMKVNKNGKLECHPIKGIKVCDCDDDNPESSKPVQIEDIPTKQVFIKKDLKYNTIITDQTTTFELYLTSEDAYVAGRSCNPYDPTSKANDCIQIGFSKYEVLQSTDIDEEDGISHSYIMSTNPSENDIKNIKVDPRTGKIIFRYLPSFTQYADREYVLMETVAPVGYDLPTGEKSVTRFKVANDTVNVEVSNVPNKPSKAIIGKYDIATGKLIPGVKFRVYKVNNYDENLTAMMQSRSEALEFQTIRDGSYEYRETFDTDTITTCIDKEGSPCSDISSTLVENTYANTDMGAQESTTTIQEGQALIQYLDTNTYYVIEEVEAPEGYSLPERESDRFTLFYIPESEEVTKETKIYNTETYFTFFKYDEFNRVKDGATFKLQKLNKDKIYEDVAVEDVSTEDTKMYRVLSTSENYDITTLNGQATIYRLTEGQYRIIETKAPEGYELPKKTYNVVTFLVDKKGHTYGPNIIANKKKTEHIEVVPEAEAELVVNIQTGKKVIKYGLIIAGILGLISLLIYIRKKVSK